MLSTTMRCSLLSRFTVFLHFLSLSFSFSFFFLPRTFSLSSIFISFYTLFFNLCYSLLLCTHTHTHTLARTNIDTCIHPQALTSTISLPLGQSIYFLFFTISPFLLFYFIPFLLPSYSFWSKQSMLTGKDGI